MVISSSLILFVKNLVLWFHKQTKCIKQQKKSVKRDKMYLMTVPKQILQTIRLSNSSSPCIARYSLNLLEIAGISNVCKLHKHYQNMMFSSMLNIFLVNNDCPRKQWHNFLSRTYVFISIETTSPNVLFGIPILLKWNIILHWQTFSFKHWYNTD